MIEVAFPLAGVIIADARAGVTVMIYKDTLSQQHAINKSKTHVQSHANDMRTTIII